MNDVEALNKAKEMDIDLQTEDVYGTLVKVKIDGIKVELIVMNFEVDKPQIFIVKPQHLVGRKVYYNTESKTYEFIGKKSNKRKQKLTYQQELHIIEGGNKK